MARGRGAYARLATPVVIGQVATLVAKWVNRIQGFVRGLLSSLRRLSPMLDRLAGVFEQLSGRNKALARADPDEFKPHLPSGPEFVNGDYSPKVADAYRRIRNSPDDTPRAAANSGLDEAVVERMRQNLSCRNMISRRGRTLSRTRISLWTAVSRPLGQGDQRHADRREA